MEEVTIPRPLVDLADRTEAFARVVREFIRKFPHTFDVREDVRQLVRSSGSVGANYIEANEALSRKDQLVRLRIAKKEAKESAYWLRLLCPRIGSLHQEECRILMDEAQQIVRIFSAILSKASS